MSRSVAAFGGQISDSLSPLKPFRLQRVFPASEPVAEIAGLFSGFHGCKINVLAPPFLPTEKLTARCQEKISTVLHRRNRIRTIPDRDLACDVRVPI
jgi:hypothetical protein